MRRGPAIFFLLIVMVASAYGAQWAGMQAWPIVFERTPSHAGTLRPTTGTTPLAAKVVLILAEGLRDEDAPFLPAVENLMQQGAHLRLTVPEPAYAMPLTATLFTGAAPISHGVLLPDLATELTSDSLLAAALRANLETAGVGTPGIPGTVLAGHLKEWHTADTPGRFLEHATRLVRPGGSKFVVLHLPELRVKSAALGTASRTSDAYKEALADWDGLVGRVLEEVDLKTTAVVLLGSTPTDVRGKFAPGEPLPLVMAGAGVKPDVGGNASLVDVAPTLAALTGLPTPLAAEGRPLFDALELSGPIKELVAGRHLQNRQALYATYVKSMGSTLTVPEAPKSLAEADAYEATLADLLERAQLDRMKQGAMERAPYLGGGLLVALIYLVIMMFQPFGRAAFRGALLYVVSFHAIFFATGGRYSAALAGLDHFDQRVLLQLGARVAGAMFVASLITGYLLSRKGFKKGPYLAVASLQMMLTTAVLIAIPAAALVWAYGWSIPGPLPPLPILVWFFVTILQVAVIGYLSLVWMLVTTWAGRYSLRKWPLKEIGDPVVNADKVVRLRTLQRTSRKSVEKR